MRILVVDDDAGSRTSVGRFLKIMGHQVTECKMAAEALTLLRMHAFPLVFSDIKMPEMSGIELLQEVSQLARERQPKVVLFTGHGSMESAIEALRMGAYDYLLKPVKAEELVAVIKKIDAGRQGVSASHREGKRAVYEEASLSSGKKICICSPKMRLVVAKALKYHTDRSMPVLIQGETGTGKELIARLIHEGGHLTKCAFVDINCAALQPNLFESELFGYRAGAFTGGLSRDQKGKFAAAKGGTIFLDEVAEIPVELQVKLLRVIQEREYYRVGGTEKLPVDARIICATNVNIMRAVNEGRFRPDLYFRLQVGQIFIPPLRERKEDILPLASAFLAEFSRQKGKSFLKLGRETEKMLLAHNWPGNVRELRNLMERAIFLHDGEVLLPEHLEHTPMDMTGEKVKEAVGGHVTEAGSLLEKHVDHLIEEAIEKYNGNKAAAARYLGISRRALYRRLEKMSK